ncbi:GNAT family N-acetyltransferase [Paenibacillus sp. MMS20-IR301]|uniref:GNAT family N-acetyltransferase n=1 Tax=Paenibacillus sp. MMS20-IR301 TaxID=2895946 RepID=UPI0028E66728|nr:GNAT family N-acetyltransferase [Paenibacillus sp. MMS20-IR301]WNS41106.1 GNAT family N-acetyltransferase [Paenibacillus sp. MMS20-IR301]
MQVIKSLLECPERRNEFAEYVKEKWPKVTKVVLPKIDESLSAEAGLPFTFLLLKNGKIIGFYQLIEQEYISRKDLSPWISPLFIDENERGRGLGSVLLEHARKMAGQLGYAKVYLTTDHILYYEKYGFREIGLDNFAWGRPTKIYEHDAIE